jgi:uncharacterized protein
MVRQGKSSKPVTLVEPNLESLKMPKYLSPRRPIGKPRPERMPQPIQRVNTCTTGFVGTAPRGPLDVPRLVTGMKKFTSVFGGLVPDSFLAYSVQGFFENGGQRCFVVRVAGDKKSIQKGLAAFEGVDEIDILCIPDIMSMWFKDGPPFDDVKIQDGIKSVQKTMIDQCEKLRDRFAVLDSIKGLRVSEIISWQQDYVDSQYAALYYPWISVKDPISAEGGTTRLIPPSGHIAGIFCRIYAPNGVPKTTANEVVLGTLDLEHAITHLDQDLLTASGVNSIRAVPGKGICLWGAKTTSSDPLWKYIHVRSLIIFLEKSILKGTEWIVFEPNGPPLWAQVKQAVQEFLTGVWQSGALVGATPQEAFFVKCDLTVMTQEDLDNGRVLLLVGVAPIKPSEFITFRICHWAGGASVED